MGRPILGLATAFLASTILLTSPLRAQTETPSVSLAVYEGGYALVEEARSVRVRKGVGRFRIDDLPRGIQPETIVVAFSDESGVVLRGQRFRQAVPSLLSLFVGRTVSVVTVNPANGDEVVRPARLLRAMPRPLVELDGRIEPTPPGRIALPPLPQGTLLKPALELDLEASRTANHSYRLSYLAQGPGWSADYALHLDPSERWARIQGRASVRAPMGRDFLGAAIRLVSGSVNRVSGGGRPVARAKAGMRVMAAESLVQADAPTPTSEVYVYALPRRIDLRAGAAEKAILFDTRRIAVEKTYHLDSHANVQVRHGGGVEKRNPVARISFSNEAANGLGMPLPGGVARLYGGGLLLGEDRLRHLPEGGRARLVMGRALDVTARRKRTDYRSQGLPKGTAEAAYEIALKNAKANAVTVEVTEAMVGEWRILSESEPHTRRSDRQAVWQIKVPASGEALLRYRVRSKFR